MDVYVEERPWGKFEKFVENQKCTVKLLYLNPNSQTSYQYHNKRDELWKVVEGSISLIINDDDDGENERILQKNDTVFIKRESKHKIINLDNQSVILEISFGEFDENDIVRLSDIYDRK